MENDELHLQHIDISDTGDFVGKLCLGLSTNYNLPLVSLAVCDNKLNDWAESQLVQLAMRSTTLTHLNISGCNLDVSSITNLIRAFTNDPEKQSYNLQMSNMKLSGTEIAGCVSALMDCDISKWNGIELNNTKFDEGAARMVLSIFTSLNHLVSISLSGCFSSKLKGIGSRLAKLIEIPTLKKLIIAGADKCRLKKEAYRLLEALSDNRSLTYLDISNNKIGSEGIYKLAQSLLRNSSIQYLNIDQNCNDFKAFQYIISVYNHTYIYLYNYN